MQSIYTWKYLRANITIDSVASSLMHLIDLSSFRTFYQLIVRPDELVYKYLKGETIGLRPVSYFTTMILLSMAIWAGYEYINNPTSFEFSTIFPETEIYLIGATFIIGTSIGNRLLFKSSRLNFLSHLLTSIFIVSQAIMYWFVGTVILAALGIQFDDSTTVLFQTSIFLLNLIYLNWQIFKQGFSLTIIKSLAVILLMSLLSGLSIIVATLLGYSA